MPNNRLKLTAHLANFLSDRSCSLAGPRNTRTMRVHPFLDGDTFTTFRNFTEKTIRDIEALENDYVLKASPAELEQYYVAQVTLTPLVLDAKNHYIDSQK